MKIIISENQSRLIRRINMIEDMLYPTMKTVYNAFLETNYGKPVNNDRLNTFMLIISTHISTKIVQDTHMSNSDDMVTLRNQLQNYIKNYYYTEMKDYFYDQNDN